MCRLITSYCYEKNEVLIDQEEWGGPRLEVVEEQHLVQAQLSEGRLGEDLGEALEDGSDKWALLGKRSSLKMMVTKIWPKKAFSMRQVEQAVLRYLAEVGELLEQRDPRRYGSAHVVRPNLFVTWATGDFCLSWLLAGWMAEEAMTEQTVRSVLMQGVRQDWV